MTQAVTRAGLFGAFLLAGCSGIGTTTARVPEGYTQVPGTVSLPRSRVTEDCGPEAVCAVLNYWGKPASVQEVSILMRDPRMPGTLSTRMGVMASRKGLRVKSMGGSVGRLKNAVDRGVPPIIMVDGGGGNFHFFVVTGYSDRDAKIVCEDYDLKRLIGYEEIESIWKAAGHLMFELERSTADDFFQRGADREAKGRHAEAASLFRQALEADADHYDARVGLANCLLALRKTEEALAEYRRAYEANPHDPKVCNNLANVYVELGREAEEAERLAGRAVDEYEAAFQRARADRDRETQPALRRLRERELGDRELDLAYALGTLGQARAAAGRYELAIAAWKASYSHFPLTHFDARAKRQYEIGGAYLKLKMPAEARLHFEQALREARDETLRAKIEAALKALK